jgi:hypothetical protein
MSGFYTEEEARVEYARLLSVAVDWSKKLQADPGNRFVQRQREIAVSRADEFGAVVLRAVLA